MSVRKREWLTAKGKQEAWVVDYADGEGKRRHKTFKRKTDAKAFEATTRVQIREGTHVPDSASVTLSEAGDLWLARCETEALERGTIEGYERHLRLHILPHIGREKLSKITVQFVRAFEDRLAQAGCSQPTIRSVRGSLGAMLSEAQERGLVVRNAVRELRGRRRPGKTQDRRKRKLQVGLDIPTPNEVRTLLAHASGKLRPFLLTAVFTGLRASELRGLRWDDVDLQKAELHVHQRADRRNVIGTPKSASGQRTVPLPPTLVQELREWKLKCPHKDGKLGLVFPNNKGNVENHENIVGRKLIPTMVAAGITRPVLDHYGVPTRRDDGEPLVSAKYTGLHALRHFFASWCINRKEDGGLALPAKVVQERMGHSSITMTMDVYGHLFPRGDDSAELAKAERLLLGV